MTEVDDKNSGTRNVFSFYVTKRIYGKDNFLRELGIESKCLKLLHRPLFVEQHLFFLNN